MKTKNPLLLPFLLCAALPAEDFIATFFSRMRYEDGLYSLIGRIAVGGGLDGRHRIVF